MQAEGNGSVAPKELLSWVCGGGLDSSRQFMITDRGVLWHSGKSAQVAWNALKALGAAGVATSVATGGKSGTTLTVASLGSDPTSGFVSWQQVTEVNSDDGKHTIYLRGGTSSSLVGYLRGEMGLLMKVHCTPENYQQALHIITEYTHK